MKCLIITYTDFEKLQGQNIRFKYIIDELLKRKHGVYLMVSANANVYRIKKLFGDKINVYKFYISTPRFAKFKLLRYALYFNLARFYIARLIKKIKPDVIYTNTLLPGWPTTKAFTKLKKHYPNLRFVYDLFDFYYDFFRLKMGLRKDSSIIRLLKEMEKYPLTKSNKIITVSKKFKKEIIKLSKVNKEKIEVVYEGADLKLFKPINPDDNLLKKYNIKSDNIIITFVGGIEKHDGLDIVIDSAEIINRKASIHARKIRFMFVGSGTYLSKLRKKVKDKKLEKNFIFTGWADYNKIQKYLSITDICLLPLVNSISSQSIITTKLYEYLASKKAVIASDLPGLHEIIKHKETGIFFKAENKDDLANKILLLVKNKKLLHNTAEKGYKKIKAKFNILDQVKKIVDIMENENLAGKSHCW